MLRTNGSLLLLCLLAPAAAPAQLPVTDIQLRADPADARVRPLESVVIQLRVYGEVADGADGETKRVRLQRSAGRFELEDGRAGWLSKPFRFQGREDEEFHQERGEGLGAVLLGRATGQFVLKDAALFTAGERAGRYRVETTLDGKTASLEIEVTDRAPSRKPAERTTFPAESRSRDRYRRLAEHYAPMVAGETWFQPKSDYLARFDLDGDWRGDNNWDRTEIGSSQAYVYYAAMETSTHWFLIYNFFHPRDYSDKCVAGTCHENDNEGMILTVGRDGSEFGRLQTMETLAHNNIYSYRNDRSVKKGVHRFDGNVELHDGAHPVVFIESGGHGVYGSDDGHSRFSVRRNEFSEGTGVTYVFKSKAERPRHPDDRNVGYELLPIYEHWWLRAHGAAKQGRAFDAYYSYEPFGRRPRPRLGEIAGSFLGRKHGSNKAKPFWGWHDNRTRKRKVLATGQWGLDPAYAVSRNLRFPGRFSVDYTYNPYLGIGEPSATDAVSTPVTTAVPPRSRSSDSQQPQQQAAQDLSGLTSFQPARARGYDEGARKGQLDLRMHVDGEVVVFVRAASVGYRALNGWPPRNDGSEYTQPLPRATFRQFKLEKKDGRGKITLVERPSADNAYTAKLRISDPKGGEDRYHARLTWERGELAPPASPRQALTEAPQTSVATEPGTPAAASVADAPTLPADPRAASRGSSILAKHMEGVRGGPRQEAPQPAQPTPQSSQPASPAPAPASSGAGPSTPAVPGTEIFSDDNDPARYNDRNEGLFEFRGRIDGTVRLLIRADRVMAESTAGRPVSVDRFSFSQPVPASRVRDMSVEKKDGRGKVVLLERPWEGNHYLAVVEISDPKGGDDRYHFRLKWRR